MCLPIKLLLYLALTALISCGRTNSHNESNTKVLNDHKAKFPDELTDHFPLTIETSDVNIVCNTNQKKNDVGLYLYEYNLDQDDIQLLVKRLRSKAVRSYPSTAPCLLVVNRFEAKASYENVAPVSITDSTLIERECYTNLLPVANFISYQKSQAGYATALGKGFTIYVLDAKPREESEEYPLAPSHQMPGKWKNGYSKGIAVNEKEGTVIYWAVIW